MKTMYVRGDHETAAVVRALQASGYRYQGRAGGKTLYGKGEYQADGKNLVLIITVYDEKTRRA